MFSPACHRIGQPLQLQPRSRQWCLAEQHAQTSYIQNHVRVVCLTLSCLLPVLHITLPQALLLPNDANIGCLLIPGEDLVDLIRVQQSVQDKLFMTVPLLDGVYVLASAADLPDTAQEFSAASAGVSDSSRAPHVAGLLSSCADAAAAAAAIPWRLRKVAAVLIHPSKDTANATLLLVGGGRVRAGAVKQGCLADAEDPQVGNRRTKVPSCQQRP